MDNNAEAGPSTAPHRMRITSGGSIPNYVKFAKSFLLDNPDRPLVLHTIPNASESGRNLKAGPSKSTTTLHSCTTTVPRLISVVEQIKRDLISTQISQDKSGSEPTQQKGKKSIKGIWQYTESGLLPAPPREEEEDVDPLVRVLEGNTRPKMTHRPYLQITLSTRPLELLEQNQNVTCQYVLSKHRNRQSHEEEGDVPTAEKGQLAASDHGKGMEASATNAETALVDNTKQAPSAGSTHHDGKVKGHKRRPSTSQENPPRDPKRSKKATGAKQKP